MQERDIAAYNACVATHTRRGSKNLSWSQNPMQYWHTYQDSRTFAKMVGYEHNQAQIVATTDDSNEHEVATLHIATANDDALYLHEIVLADPSRPLLRPMGPDQRHAGIGNGVFSKVLENIRALAGQHGRDKVILYAMDSVRAGVFARKGFSLDLNEPDLIARSQANGLQIPMVASALK